MYKIPSDFIDFIKNDCNRAAFIQSYLNKAGLDTALLQMEGKNHIYVKFPLSQYNPAFRIKTVIAHYDRFPASPGANDNSAAVYCLLQFAAFLAKNYRQSFHNIRLIFTDGEELGEGGVKEQGAFPLAQVFRRLGIKNDDVFVFDCMGRGDIPVLSQTILPSGLSQKFIKDFMELEERTKKLLLSAAGSKFFCLPCNYSDNASFLANGIPAVAVTMLPASEVNLVLNGQTPPTWTFFHTEKDNFESLTPESFEIFLKILYRLAELKTLV